MCRARDLLWESILFLGVFVFVACRSIFLLIVVEIITLIKSDIVLLNREVALRSHHLTLKWISHCVVLLPIVLPSWRCLPWLLKARRELKCIWEDQRIGELPVSIIGVRVRRAVEVREVLSHLLLA